MPISISGFLHRNKGSDIYRHTSDDEQDNECTGSKNDLICLSDKSILFIGNKGLFHKNCPLSSRQAFYRAGRLGMSGIECELWESAHDENGKFKLIVTNKQFITDKDGIERDISLLTPRQIREFFPHPKNSDGPIFEICAFRKFLVICSLYNMIPYITIKQKNLSKKALARIYRMLVITQNIDKAFIISNRTRILERFQRYSSDHHYDNIRYLINYAEHSRIYETNGAAYISKLAAENKYTGIRIPKEILTKEIYDDCSASGLLIDIYTFKRNELDILTETIANYPHIFSIELRVRL